MTLKNQVHLTNKNKIKFISALLSKSTAEEKIEDAKCLAREFLELTREKIETAKEVTNESFCRTKDALARFLEDVEDSMECTKERIQYFREQMGRCTNDDKNGDGVSKK